MSKSHFSNKIVYPQFPRLELQHPPQLWVVPRILSALPWFPSYPPLHFRTVPPNLPLMESTVWLRLPFSLGLSPSWRNHFATLPLRSACLRGSLRRSPGSNSWSRERTLGPRGNGTTHIWSSDREFQCSRFRRGFCQWLKRREWLQLTRRQRICCNQHLRGGLQVRCSSGCHIRWSVFPMCLWAGLLNQNHLGVREKGV